MDHDQVILEYKRQFSSIDFRGAQNGLDCKRILDRELERMQTDRSNHPLVRKNPEAISQSERIQPSGRSAAANTDQQNIDIQEYMEQ